MRTMIIMLTMAAAACGAREESSSPSSSPCPDAALLDSGTSDAGVDGGDPCLETDHSIAACLRGAGATAWTAVGACAGAPKKIGAGGEIVERAKGRECCAPLSYQGEALLCCPESCP